MLFCLPGRYLLEESVIRLQRGNVGRVPWYKDYMEPLLYLPCLHEASIAPV